MELKGVKNIIFDLGGVIINIDPQLTFNAFRKLAQESGTSVDFSKDDVFREIETGLIDDIAFRNKIRIFVGDVDDQAIDDAWNRLLLDLPLERLDLLLELKSDYRVILLSNTNAIHMAEIKKRIGLLPEKYAFSNLFEKEYYSHLVKLRKPGKEIYQLIVDELAINPSETIFIDDIYENAKAAEMVGIQGWHLDLSKHDLVKFFNNVRK